MTVEAMACGTPVIVLDTSAVKELVDGECGVVLHENNAIEYLEAIKLIESKNLSEEKIAKKASAYDKERMVRNVLGLYQMESEI